jgi:hypothetical protein
VTQIKDEEHLWRAITEESTIDVMNCGFVFDNGEVFSAASGLVG